MSLWQSAYYSVVLTRDFIRGRPESLRAFPSDIEDFWPSFGAMLLVLPFIILAMLVEWQTMDLGAVVHLTGMQYVVGRLAFAYLGWALSVAAILPLLQVMQFGKAYIPLVIVLNWTTFVLEIPIAIVNILILIGLFSGAMGTFITLGLLPLIYFIRYRMVQTMLGPQSQSVPLAVIALELVIGFGASLLAYQTLQI